VIEDLGAAALRSIPGAAFLRSLVPLTRQFAELRFALAHRAAAVAVGLLLAGRRPIGDLAHRLDGGGDNRFHRAHASAERQAGGGEQQEPCAHLKSFSAIDTDGPAAV